MELTERFKAALDYALELHWFQKRKGTNIPYYSHLMAVAALVMEHGESEDEVIAALLHDAAEDQGGMEVLAEIGRRFGPNVAQLVCECSDVIVDRKDDKPPWKERKLAYIDKIKSKSRAARLISSADKLHNARAILREYRQVGDDLWARFNPNKEEILWYYRSMVQHLREYYSSPIVEELARVVSDIEKVTVGNYPPSQN